MKRPVPEAHITSPPHSVSMPEDRVRDHFRQGVPGRDLAAGVRGPESAFHLVIGPAGVSDASACGDVELSLTYLAAYHHRARIAPQPLPP